MLGLLGQHPREHSYKMESLPLYMVRVQPSPLKLAQDLLWKILLNIVCR